MIKEERRKYRFRVWDLSDHRMYPVISIARGGITVQDDEMLKTCQRERVVMMQYSGLLDVAGQEIYEHDIVKLSGAHPPATAQIAFTGGSFRLENLTPDTVSLNEAVLSQALIDDLNVSVAGNIHQSK